MKKLYFLDEQEKNRILNLHTEATRKQYLKEGKMLLNEKYAGLLNTFRNVTGKMAKKKGKIVRGSILKGVGDEIPNFAKALDEINPILAKGFDDVLTKLPDEFIGIGSNGKTFIESGDLIIYTEDLINLLERTPKDKILRPREIDDFVNMFDDLTSQTGGTQKFKLKNELSNSLRKVSQDDTFIKAKFPKLSPSKTTSAVNRKIWGNTGGLGNSFLGNVGDLVLPTGLKQPGKNIFGRSGEGLRALTPKAFFIIPAYTIATSYYMLGGLSNKSMKGQAEGLVKSLDNLCGGFKQITNEAGLNVKLKDNPEAIKNGIESFKEFNLGIEETWGTDEGKIAATIKGITTPEQFCYVVTRFKINEAEIVPISIKQQDNNGISHVFISALYNEFNNEFFGKSYFNYYVKIPIETQVSLYATNTNMEEQEKVKAEDKKDENKGNQGSEAPAPPVQTPSVEDFKKFVLKLFPCLKDGKFQYNPALDEARVILGDKLYFPFVRKEKESKLFGGWDDGTIFSIKDNAERISKMRGFYCSGTNVVTENTTGFTLGVDTFRPSDLST